MHILTLSQQRLYKKLSCDLGAQILNFLAEPDVHEIMLNPDGKLWIDLIGKGPLLVGDLLVAQTYAILHVIAGINGLVVSQYQPRIEVELPYFEKMHGERFIAAIPPIVSAPCFTIRKHSKRIFTLDNYVYAKLMNDSQANLLKRVVRERKNILVCGGPSSGKTTMVNALIYEAVQVDMQQRFLILEDLPELQCTAPNSIAMVTTPTVSMRDLLHAAMRLRPDRILIGEVRGAEALDLLKAWNTGCPGGIGTLHANGAETAVQRLTDLAMEAGLSLPPWELVLQTLDIIVCVERRNHLQGFIQQIVALRGRHHEKFLFETLA